MAFSGHGFAVEVGVGDGFGDNAAVVGGVTKSDDIIQRVCPRLDIQNLVDICTFLNLVGRGNIFNA